jgi:hypothetical protein
MGVSNAAVALFDIISVKIVVTKYRPEMIITGP